MSTATKACGHIEHACCNGPECNCAAHQAKRARTATKATHTKRSHEIFYAECTCHPVRGVHAIFCKKNPRNHTPTPGAVKAAQEVLTALGGNEMLMRIDSLKVAAIIDRETAAPEMLEALESIRTLAAYMNSSGNGVLGTLANIGHKADAAIRKARGEK